MTNGGQGIGWGLVVWTRGVTQGTTLGHVLGQHTSQIVKIGQIKTPRRLSLR